ncbi:Putative clPB chaperone protein with AAA ATPase domain protein (fragment). Homolog to OMM_3 MMP [Desulfamplus magnetovallimortis]|uniref:Putative clPB chaperone protein with AAA ATPase domain protein. Homolog to OMM_3 MMP n=1 Tax=Desulfamplus magnetovallimortis TaxID=1246637 RepID=L0R3Z2_9BACT
MQTSPLFLVRYEDHSRELNRIIQAEQHQGRATMVWNQVQGFTLYHDSKIYPLSEKNDSVFKNPKDAVRFIINRVQTKVVYILEDFHHFLGDKNAVHADVGEIRALIKEIARSFYEREEKVYLFVPPSYELPDELVSFFDLTYAAEKNKTEFLQKYGTLLTEKKYLEKSKPVIGAENQIERVVQILSQMETNNPLLVGNPGVGKTAIVEGFARALHTGDVPLGLHGKLLYLVSLNTLVAGTKYRGDFEQRLEGLIKEVQENKNRIIVFIDEIHTLLGVGAAEGAIGAVDSLKPVLARGEFPCIGATTFDGAKLMLKDPALSRRFKKIQIKEATPEETFIILKGISKSLETHHKLTIEDRALMAAVYLSEDHIPDEYFPGKAIALVDAAAAYCSMKKIDTVRESDIAMEVERMGVMS